MPLCTWSEIVGVITDKNPELFKPFKPKFCSGPNKEGYPQELKKDLINIIKDIEGYYLTIFNEEATKYLIVLPLLEKLGWHIQNQCQVFPENHFSERRVDYVLRDFKSNQTCIEVKSANDPDLEKKKNVKQIRWYCSSKNVDLGILTKGIVWKFYFFDFYEGKLGAIKNIKTKKIGILHEKPKKSAEKFIKYLWKDNLTKNPHKPYENSLQDIILSLKGINEDDYHNYNESVVKQVVLMPLLKNLDWNTYKPHELIFDNVISRRKVDYILAPYSVNQVVIEVKAMGSELDFAAEDHVIKFATSGKYKMAVLTDGIDWRFYYFENRKYMDDFRFKINELDLEEIIEVFKNTLSKKRVLDGIHLSYFKN